ncbi:MAG TPA: class I SAM-dependent methyltransferase [Solirubrobacteraceae bacterium]|nr:class I SAM-dependent methyltransferase [Solirubrobacteraceae bacterium]
MRRLSEATARTRRELRLALSLRALPPRVARFFWRARRLAARSGDDFSLLSPARPAELAELLALARGRTAVVELGTGTAWSSIALALHDSKRRVISCDPIVRSQREAYLELAGAVVRARIELRAEPDDAGPRPGDPPVELLFVDSSHERKPTVAAFRAWRGALAPGALVVFHDHANAEYPGVREAVEELELAGETRASMFVWHAPSAGSLPMSDE